MVIEKKQFLTSCYFIFSVLLFLKLLFLQFLIYEKIRMISAISEFLMVGIFLAIIEILFGKIKRKWIVYWLISIMFSVLLMFTCMYYHSFGNVLTYYSFLQIEQVVEVKDSILGLIEPIYFLFFADLLLLPFLCENILRKNKEKQFIDTQIVTMILVCFTVINTLLLSNITKKEITNEIAKVEKVGFFNYELLLVVDKVKSGFEKVSVPSTEKLQNIKGIIQKDEPEYFGVAKNKNVIVIQIESFQNFLIGSKVNTQEITPNLNRLINESFYFPNFYQQVGKGNTSDAEFLLNTSIYPTGVTPMSESYADKELPSFPRILKLSNYTSATFHTNDKKFWNRGEFYKALGFDKVYDKSFYGEENKLRFGSVDDILYSKSIQPLLSMKQTGKPFYVNYITMTSHSPFEMPDNMEELELPKDLDGDIIGDYLQSAKYTDSALGRFFNLLKKNGLWDDSVIVLYGDHMGLAASSLNSKQIQSLQDISGKEYNRISTMNVPFIIRVPDVKGTIIDNIGGQVDLMPTIANLVGINLSKTIHFGRDILNNNNNLLPERFYLPAGSFINQDVAFIPGEGIEDGQLFDVRTFKQIQSPDDIKKDFKKSIRLMDISNTYLESLPELKNEKEK